MAGTHCGISTIKTARTFFKVGTCSETLCNVLNRAFNDPMQIEEQAAMPLAGGIVKHGYQCGVLWGSTLAAGAQAFRLFGPGPQTEARAIMAAGKIVESFETRYRNINCLKLTGTDWRQSGQAFRHFIKGGTIRCYRMAGKFASVAFREINAGLAENQDPAISLPVSCAATLARKMGASEKHTVMAAGLAGGIGLCGGACGALGAAIWINAMKDDPAQGKKKTVDNPRAMEAIDKFIKVTDGQFECSKIVGRKFESVDDHAKYLRNGGCSKIIETLADI